jgi:LacI family transcriptional regulator
MEYYDIYNLKQNTVLAGQPFDGELFDNVYTDEFNGAFKAVDFLIKSGRKKIMMIDNFLFKIGENKRYQGYVAALEKNNIKYSDKLHKVVGKLDRMHRINEGRKIIEKAVKEKIKFDAVFTFNDLLAFGVIKGLHESGIKIPEEVCVMGYDDLDLSSMVTPSLSTVRYDKFDMGQKIVKTLMKRLKKPDKKTEKIKIETDLVIRSSTKEGK